jgi:type IV pilus assembly protein PilM
MSSLPLTRRAANAVDSVSESSVHCAACDSVNRPERRFCGNCGARLWESCLKCGHENAPVERHCGQCGVNLQEELQRIQRDIQAVLDEADRLGRMSEHVQAIERLLAIEIVDHGALTRHRETRDERVAALRSEMRQRGGERDLAIVRGRYLLERSDYEQAALVLEAVPHSYRTTELVELLDQVRSRQIDVLTLAGEIRRAVAEKRTDGLLPKVEQLLALKPDHAQARSLAERLRPVVQKKKLALRDALYKTAKAHLDACNYAAAVEQLEQIPAELCTSQLVTFIEETRAKAAEVDWLTRDLTQAVVPDEWHGPLAERLLKLQPNNAVAATIAQRNKAGKRVCPAPPPTSQWAGRLETIAGFRHIDLSALSDASTRSHPSRLAVAAGLALVGLERAWLSINLAPSQKEGLLAGLLKIRGKASRSAWGVDLGQAALRAVRLVTREGGGVLADAAYEVEHSQILTAPDADREAIVRASLDKLLHQAKLTDAPLCVSVPGHKALFRALRVPLVDEKKLGELMKFEVREQIPIATEHIVWDYQALSARQTQTAPVLDSDVALLALKSEYAQAAISPFAERGLKVEVLSPDSVGLLNFVMFESATSPESPGQHPAAVSAASSSGSAVHGKPVTAVLDVGVDSSNFIVTDGRSVALRSIAVGGNSFSRLLVKELQLTFMQAEKVKRNPTAVRHLHRLHGILEPRFADLSREMHRTIDAFLQADPARRLDRFIFTGGGLKLHGAVRRLWYGE